MKRGLFNVSWFLLGAISDRIWNKNLQKEGELVQIKPVRKIGRFRYYFLEMKSMLFVVVPREIHKEIEYGHQETH
jgi:hypothetical protein